MPLPGVKGVTDEAIFSSLNVCLIGWFILALPPAYRPRQYEHIVVCLCAIFGALYSLTLASAVATGEVPQGSGFDSLDGVATLFSSKAVVLSGWTHYVCFDLLAGLFIVKDNNQQTSGGGLPHAVIALFVLPLTLFAGPTGLLASHGSTHGWVGGSPRLTSIYPLHTGSHRYIQYRAKPLTTGHVRPCRVHSTASVQYPCT